MHADLERRSFLLGGAALGAAALAGEQGLARLRPAGPAPRSARPHGGADRRLETRVVWHTGAQQRRLALTFDDGPDPRWTPLVLDLLARHGVPATFYVVGSRAQEHRDLLARVAGAGHEIGNHTWSHADLCRTDAAGVRRELQRTAEAVERITGTAPRTVRPPWGSIDAAGLLAAAELGCSVALWSELVRAADPQAGVQETLRDVRGGSVLLAHDGGPTPTTELVAAVDGLVATLRDRGWEFGTVSALLDEPHPPAAVPPPPRRSA